MKWGRADRRGGWWGRRNGASCGWRGKRSVIPRRLRSFLNGKRRPAGRLGDNGRSRKAQPLIWTKSLKKSREVGVIEVELKSVVMLFQQILRTEPSISSPREPEPDRHPCRLRCQPMRRAVVHIDGRAVDPALYWRTGGRLQHTHLSRHRQRRQTAPMQAATATITARCCYCPAMIGNFDRYRAPRR
jgi:hypothetical protein